MRIVTIARKPCAEHSTTQNVLTHACGALCIDRCRVQSGTQPKPTTAPGWDSMNAKNAKAAYRPDAYQQGDASYVPDEGGRWPANVVLCAAATTELDRQSGFTISGRHGGAPGGFGAAQLYGDGSRTLDLSGGYLDSGAASRFFKAVGS